ncbi:hypothetical protein DSECCO2_521250 [anaerobic digester metagenome]
MVAADTFVEGSKNGHGPDAVDERGVDHAVHEPGVGGAHQPLELGGQAGEAVLEVQGLAHDASDEDAQHHEQPVLALQGHLHADDQHAQTQALKNDLAHLFRKTSVQQQPQCTADQDGQGVDDGTERENHDMNSM